jgi:hypothetical protein
MMQAIDLPWGTSIVVLAQKVQAESARSQE